MPPHWNPDAFWSEAISALAGPVAEDLFGDGYAIGSFGELSRRGFAERAAQLTGRDENGAWCTALTVAISLGEQCETPIREIADVLVRKRRIWCGDRPIRSILVGVPRGPIVTAPLSARGQALFEKIGGGLAHLQFLGDGVMARKKLLGDGL